MSIIVGSLVLVGSTPLMPIRQASAEHGTPITYSEDIAPIFRGWCVSCHQPGGEGYSASELDLTTYQGLMKGTKFGPMVIPGEPDASNLIVLLGGQVSSEIRMPHGHKPLPNCLRRNMWNWIFDGAKDD
ncbi:MAG: hypothetical protein N2C12_07980 [Planctomycetales bacterium]